MACHEVAALRLGMMNVIGIKDEATVQHERAEIGEEALKAPGPIRSLAEAKDFESLIQFYEASLTDLEQMISKTKKDDPKMAYYRSLLILTKKVELELKNSIQSFQNLYRDLEEIHDFVHEIYPA
ncbi:hypothetical protein A0128_21185 [Leptospira tipperaryensis]|uniref:DUF3209 domain-containing protein n=1 Tax=Leptospira tipperaryensis TaxID=2564040 RepID=A0A1D7V3Z3_9LEPT|nr:DUF3209 family protein [Leptospira tipperaryensis]AOP36525.1 hypothetical protein A0128_21185 [Leptospira tipperaryensis]